MNQTYARAIVVCKCSSSITAEGIHAIKFMGEKVLDALLHVRKQDQLCWKRCLEIFETIAKKFEKKEFACIEKSQSPVSTGRGGRWCRNHS
jgi:hypothetical protein